MKKKVSANDIFEKYISKNLLGKNSEETIKIFCNLNQTYFYDIAKKYKLKERQISALIGFKDEFFVQALIGQIIEEKGLSDKFYCKKVTANEKAGLSARAVKFNGQDKILTIGGDCVIFRKSDNKPLMIIECKEYIDMIRMKELIGESQILKGNISKSVSLLEDVQFCVFSEVLELTNAWADFLKNSDQKHKIDQIFVMRAGKRKDKANKPVEQNLREFKNYIEHFIVNFK